MNIRLDALIVSKTIITLRKLDIRFTTATAAAAKTAAATAATTIISYVGKYKVCNPKNIEYGNQVNKW